MVRKHYKSFTENSLNKHFFEKSAQRQANSKRSTVVLPSILKTGRASPIGRRLHARIFRSTRRVASRRRCTCSSRICSLVARHSSRLKCKNRGSSRHLSSVRPSSPVRPCIYGLQHRLIAIYFLPAKRAICMYIDRHGCKTA